MPRITSILLVVCVTALFANDVNARALLTRMGARNGGGLKPSGGVSSSSPPSGGTPSDIDCSALNTKLTPQAADKALETLHTRNFQQITKTEIGRSWKKESLYSVGNKSEWIKEMNKFLASNPKLWCSKGYFLEVSASSPHAISGAITSFQNIACTSMDDLINALKAGNQISDNSLTPNNHEYVLGVTCSTCSDNCRVAVLSQQKRSSSARDNSKARYTKTLGDRTPTRLSAAPATNAKYIIDVGVGMGQYGLLKTATSDLTKYTMLQTEYGPPLLAAIAISSKNFSLDSAMPFSHPNGVKMFCDVLGEGDKFLEDKSVARMYLNNIDAHFSCPAPTDAALITTEDTQSVRVSGSSVTITGVKKQTNGPSSAAETKTRSLDGRVPGDEYNKLAEVLCKIMAVNGEVDIQWASNEEYDMSNNQKAFDVHNNNLEKYGTSRSHINAICLGNAIASKCTSRTITLTNAAPQTDIPYTVDASPNDQGTSEQFDAKKAKIGLKDPVVDNRVIIKFTS